MEQNGPPAPRADVYTDGGCDPNPGPDRGGWGAIVRLDRREGTQITHYLAL